MASGINKGYALWRNAALVYAALLFIASTVSVPKGVPEIFELDKLLHFGAYMVLGWLVAAAFKASGRTTHLVLLGFAFAFSFGALMEFWQHFLPDRTFSPADALANGAGALTGAYLSWRRFYLTKRGVSHEPL